MGTVVVVTRSAFCNSSETAMILAGIWVRRPFAGSLPIMVKGQICPWLLNARVKLGTESMPGNPPGLPFALDWPLGTELLNIGPERRDRGVANLKPNLAPG